MPRQKRSRGAVRWLWRAIVFFSLASLAAQSSDDLATGVALFEDGQFAAAQQFFGAFVARYPIDPAGAYYLGRLAFNGEQYEQAGTWFEKAVELNSGNADYHLWLGRTYGQRALHASESGGFFLARKVKTHLEKAVELNPDNIEARFDLLEYYLQAPAFLGGDLAKAKEQAKEIAKRNGAEGRKAWQMCEYADAKTAGEEAASPQNEPTGTEW